MGDLHTEHHVFTQKKLQHATAIGYSPRRGHGEVPPEHPYANTMQPPLPHYSQENFESKKRIHATEIRCSPRREREAAAAQDMNDGGMTGGHAEQQRIHKSQRSFAIEKLEHLTPVLPVSQPQPKHADRDPSTFRHTSCDGLAKAKMGHKTPLYPEAPVGRRDGRQGGSSVIDNYLNIKPHEDGFLHSSHETFFREKMGHLTQINTGHATAQQQKAATDPAAPPPMAEEGGMPHRSAEEFTRKKMRHSTDIRASPMRNRSQERSVEGEEARPRSGSPPGCYSSRQRFQQDKGRHRTAINPLAHGAPAPRDAGSNARGGDRGGYRSFANLSVDKKRHVADVDAAKKTGSGATPQRHSRTMARQIPEDEVHQSHVDFTEEKMKHLTTIHQSPPRNRPASAEKGFSPGYYSQKELQRAKRGHAAEMGRCSRSPASGGGAGAPAASPQRPAHVSHKEFERAKRGHVTGICASPAPPQRGRQEPEMSPGVSPSRRVSAREFSAEKRRHIASIQAAPPSYPGHGGSNMGASPDRGYMTSHVEFTSHKQRHSYEMDSPRRSQQRAAPQMVQSPSIPPSSLQGTPARMSDGGQY